MELKFQLQHLLLDFAQRSNRTFMELKYGVVLGVKLTQLVLIAPLWN